MLIRFYRKISLPPERRRRRYHPQELYQHTYHHNLLPDLQKQPAQEIVTGAKEVVESKKESFSMEDRTLDVTVPDMGTLDGLSGYDGGMIGAAL